MLQANPAVKELKNVPQVVQEHCVPFTATVLQENLAVVVLVNVTQAVLENHVPMMTTALQEKPVVVELTNVPQVVLEHRSLKACSNEVNIVQHCWTNNVGPTMLDDVGFICSNGINKNTKRK